MFLSLIDGLFGRSDIFGLVLASADLLGFGQSVGFFSNIFPDVSITIGYLPSLGLFIFTRCVTNTLEVWKNLEDSTPFLGFPFSNFEVRNYLEEAPKLPENFRPFPRELAHISCLISSWNPLLSLGCILSDRSFVGVSTGS